VNKIIIAIVSTFLFMVRPAIGQVGGFYTNSQNLSTANYFYQLQFDSPQASDGGVGTTSLTANTASYSFTNGSPFTVNIAGTPVFYGSMPGTPGGFVLGNVQPLANFCIQLYSLPGETNTLSDLLFYPQGGSPTAFPDITVSNGNHLYYEIYEFTPGYVNFSATETITSTSDTPPSSGNVSSFSGYTTSFGVVPEPSPLAAIFIGLGLLGVANHWRRRKLT
jgi:hypothetical protein